ERPEPRREPCVQDVRVLVEVEASALRATARILARDDHLLASGGAAIPRGNPVTPPELPRDAPVPDPLQPVLVHLRVAIRDEADAPLARRGERGLRQRLHPDEPLLRQPWFHDRVAAVAV